MDGHLIDYCRRNYDRSVYVRGAQDRRQPNMPQGWSQLFVRSFQGAIRLFPATEDAAPSSDIGSTTDHPDAELDAFLSYFRGLDRQGAR